MANHVLDTVLDCQSCVNKASGTITKSHNHVHLFSANGILELFFPYGQLNSIVTGNVSQFIAQLFRYLCAILWINRIQITAYHSQSNGQTEEYKKSLATRLWHYYFDHQTDWDS